MTALREVCADIGRDGLFHGNIATFEGIFGEAGLFQRSLDVHAVVHDVGDKLCVGSPEPGSSPRSRSRCGCLPSP